MPTLGDFHDSDRELLILTARDESADNKRLYPVD